MTVENYNFNKDAVSIIATYFGYRNYVLNLYYLNEESAREVSRDNVVGIWKIKKLNNYANKI